MLEENTKVLSNENHFTTNIPISYLSNKPYYFFYYYITKRSLNYDNSFSSESLDIQKKIWDFKDGVTQDYFTKLVISKVKDILFGIEDKSNVIFLCIPASTVASNKTRYLSFSNKICKECNIINGYNFITIINEKEPKHLTNEYTKSEYKFDIAQLQNKKIIIFDDVVTKGNSMCNFISQLENIGAKVIYCLSLAHTYYEPKHGANPLHPYSKHQIKGSYVSDQNDYINDIVFFENDKKDNRNEYKDSITKAEQSTSEHKINEKPSNSNNDIIDEENTEKSSNKSESTNSETSSSDINSQSKNDAFEAEYYAAMQDYIQRIKERQELNKASNLKSSDKQNSSINFKSIKTNPTNFDSPRSSNTEGCIIFVIIIILFLLF